ncbi:MAG: hypothetical protein LBP58_10800 [Azoarcus sp.]|jgi:hypothetical protein|nr:hypothetical protein [Azoarcus sp.]
MSYSNKLNAFMNGTGSLAFDCITKRDDFVKDLTDRHKVPSLINQDKTPLCGPAAFMYCIARENPDVYGEYVLDLAMTGEGRIGNLTVTVGRDCRKAELNPNGEEIAPVDWVALASLRDASNKVLDMESPGSKAAGITSSGTLAGWFRKTGWFKSGVIDTGNTFFTEDLKNLLEINLYQSGAYICMLLKDAIIQPTKDPGINKIGKKNAPKSPWNGPTHWIVLGDNNPALGTGCLNKGIRITVPGRPAEYPFSPGDKALLEGDLYFKAYSWGKITEVTVRYADLTVEQFLRYYYGYVIAAK